MLAHTGRDRLLGTLILIVGMVTVSLISFAVLHCIQGPFREGVEDRLQAACQTAGLVDVAGKPTISAHRFRHTVGTQLAQRGARLHTIMSVLGHTSKRVHVPGLRTDR